LKCPPRRRSASTLQNPSVLVSRATAGAPPAPEARETSSSAPVSVSRRYRGVLIARNGAGASQLVRLAFRVVRR
jgi:hypothetical protein